MSISIVAKGTNRHFLLMLILNSKPISIIEREDKDQLVADLSVPAALVEKTSVAII